MGELTGLKLRRVLLTASNKDGLVDLAKALTEVKADLVATGRTAKVLEEAGMKVTPIEEISGSPEAFQGRMKTLSFPVCSGILYRRGDESDEMDVKKLKVQPIDCVVVNFYPFEEACQRTGITREQLIEEIDIGGPTLVRAAAKNSPHVLVLTSPNQYAQVIQDLRETGEVRAETIKACTEATWDYVHHYDAVIAGEFGQKNRLPLRYGENPHQKGYLDFDPQGPIAWEKSLTQAELSYNNILDLSAGYALASDLREMSPDSTGVVIIKHNNPCGVASVPRQFSSSAQKLALTRAWEGDPVSAFGGVVIFTDPIEEETAQWLKQYFVELVAAPDLKSENPSLQILLSKRKNLKAIEIRRFGEVPRDGSCAVPGGKLFQTADSGVGELLTVVTSKVWPSEKNTLAKFGIAVCRSLKSNAVAIVREVPGIKGAMQLVGAGQGQPNRVEALKSLAIPRTQRVLGSSDGKIEDCVLISDAFFPFRDTVDAAHEAGLRWIVQPGGSVRDSDSIAACNELGVGMVFTGVRHFRH